MAFLAGASTADAAPLTIEALARDTQFANPHTSIDTYTGNDLVSVSAATPRALAGATPFVHHAESHSANTGTSIPEGQVRYSGLELQFSQFDPFLAGIAPTSNSTVDLLLHYSIAVFADTNDIPSTLGQSIASVFTNNIANSLVVSTGDGNHQILNSSSAHSFSNNGVFAGLAENGGTVDFTLAARINPNHADPTQRLIRLNGSHTANGGLALTNGFSDAVIDASIPFCDPSFVTLTDGTPLSVHGISWQCNVNAAVVPEPHLYGLLLLTLGVLGLRRRR